MKINIVSYLSPYDYSGGGEFISKKVIDYAKSLDYEINISSVFPKQNNYEDDADFDLVFDIFNFPEIRGGGAWNSFGSYFLYQILKKKNFIHFNNSYVDLCDLSYLPCSGLYKSNCNHKKGFSLKNFLSKKEPVKCSINKEIRKSFFSESKANVFLSPLHQKISNNLLSNFFDLDQLNKKSIILNPVVESNKFFNKNIKRDIEYLFVGVISEAKGFYNLKSKYNNSDIHFIGNNSVGRDLDFGTYHGFIKKEELVNYYNRAKNFVYLPRWPEPQGMVVIEAALCGCNIIGNDNVGSLSFDFDISKNENFRNSLMYFWKNIEKIIYG